MWYVYSFSGSFPNTYCPSLFVDILYDEESDTALNPYDCVFNSFPKGICYDAWKLVEGFAPWLREPPGII